MNITNAADTSTHAVSPVFTVAATRHLRIRPDGILRTACFGRVAELLQVRKRTGEITELRCRSCRREEESLGLVAAECNQFVELYPSFDAFSHDGEAEGMTEVHDRGDDRRVLGIGTETVDERPVDLHRV